jgi:hypothetical protein
MTSAIRSPAHGGRLRGNCIEVSEYGLAGDDRLITLVDVFGDGGLTRWTDMWNTARACDDTGSTQPE